MTLKSIYDESIYMEHRFNMQSKKPEVKSTDSLDELARKTEELNKALDEQGAKQIKKPEQRLE